MAQAIITKYLPATNTRGPRIQVKSWLATTVIAYPKHEEGMRAHLFAITEHIGHIEEIANRDGGKIQYTVIMPACAELERDYMGAMPDQSGYAVLVE